MSTLYLIRHAQASFLEANYDKLSSLGETQSTLLGGHFVNSGVTFDRVFVGPLARQQKTCSLVGRVYQDAGRPWPDPQNEPALTEYQGEELLKRTLPRLMTADTHLQTLAESFAKNEHSDMRSRAKTFQRMFEHVMLRWVRGEIVEEGIEPWNDFIDRVGSFLQRMRESTVKGERVAVFTSGGCIGAAMQHALLVSNDKGIELSWMVINASVTEFAFNPERVTLDKFNNIPHLRDEKLITYR